MTNLSSQNERLRIYHLEIEEKMKSDNIKYSRRFESTLLKTLFHCLEIVVWKSALRQTFCIPDTGLRSGSREFSHVSHESEVSPLLGGESRHKAEFGDEVHKRRLMTHFRRSLLGTFQPITREKGYFIGLPFTPLHLHVYNIVKNSKDLLILKSTLFNSISRDLLVIKSMLFYPINDGQNILSASMKI